MSMQTTDIPPNHTLYVSNLNEKIKKEELKKALYHVFSQFGNILEIVATKTYKLRGQAWIIFDDLAGATKALKEMQGFNFYSKPIRVQFAKAKSDIISKMDGTFKPREKRKPDAPPKASKQQQAKKKRSSHHGESKEEEKEKVTENGDAHPSTSTSMNTSSSSSSSTVSTSSTSLSNSSNQSNVTATSAPVQTPIRTFQSDLPSPPNRILFVENLPPECNQMMLTMLFQQYSGFQEVRLVTGKPGIAFVEYTDEFCAGVAKNALQNFKITANNLMKISFAKK